MKTKNENPRTALLNTGKDEFLLHGYRGVSIRNIATKAGATTGVVCVYFENKGVCCLALTSSM
jgi:AcrR family transcriptional regulator